jgi:hypothetical protein
MDRGSVFALIAVLVFSLIVTGAVLAQGPTGYGVSRGLVSLGGGQMSSASFGVEGSIAHLTADDAQGDRYGVRQGAWFPVRAYWQYLPVVMRDS